MQCVLFNQVRFWFYLNFKNITIAIFCNIIIIVFLTVRLCTELWYSLQDIIAIIKEVVVNRKCRSNSNRFCYICGQVTLSDRWSPITNFVKKSYHAYFGVKLGDQDKAFAPHICCKIYVEGLRRCSNKKQTYLSFGVPMVWREGKDHTTDCYFCMTNLNGINRKNKQHVKYPDVPSAIKPVPHGTEIPIPTPPDNLDSSSDSCEEMDVMAMLMAILY